VISVVDVSVAVKWFAEEAVGSRKTHPI